MLDDISLVTGSNLILSQDGASPHNGIVVRNYLNERIENCWIGII
jgi:hypothetical protein